LPEDPPILINVDPLVHNLNDAMTNCHHGTLVLYPGTHEPQSLVWDQGVSIIGSGRQNTIIKPTTGQIGILATGLYHCSLSHLTIDLSNITSNGVGIKLLKCRELLLEDIAIINVPETVTAVQIQGQYDDMEAYATSSNNTLRDVSILNVSGRCGTGIKVIDSSKTRLENVSVWKPTVGIQLECQDTLNRGGYTEATSIRDVSIYDPSQYGYRHLNARNPAVPGNPTANASFAFTRIEHMDINLHTAGSTGFYIPGATADPLGTCTLDRCAVDQLNIWFHANNTVGIRLGCSADQLSIRNVILENFNTSGTCKGIVIDSTFGGKNIQWLQKPLIIGETYGIQIDDPYNLIDSKCFGFINKHVRNDSNDSPAIDRWYSDWGSDLKAEIDGSTGNITATGLTVNGNAKIAGYTQFNNDAKLTWVNTSTLAVQDSNGNTTNGALDVGSIFVNNLQPLNSGTPAGININCPLSIGGSRGNSGQVLTSNGSSASPTWQSIPGQQWTAGTVSNVSAPLSISSNALTISQASGSTNGYLSSSDWNTFNNKYGSGSTPTFNGISMNGNIIPTVAGSPSAGYYCGSSNYPWQMVDTYYLYANTINTLSGSTVNMACTLAFGNNPFTISNTSTITNLNADMIDGQHGSFYQNASNLNAGTVPTARLGSGTANNGTYLRGDSTWATLPAAQWTAGSVSSVDTPLSVSGGHLQMSSTPTFTGITLSNGGYSTGIAINTSHVLEISNLPVQIDRALTCGDGSYGLSVSGIAGVSGTLTCGGLNLSNPTISNVTSSRQLSVDRNSVYYSYYNNSGRALLVHACVVITGTGANGYFSSQIVLGWSSGYEIIANAQNDYCTRSNSFTFLVPNGWHYQIKDSSASGHNGGVTLQSVHEILL
jgi:hypothetical protein